MEKKEHSCACCGTATRTVHDYRAQKIKDIPAFGKQVYAHYLTNYFGHFSSDERNQVKYFISDMWKTYSNISSVWFKDATRIVDKYHWIRQVIWAFERIRKPYFTHF